MKGFGGGNMQQILKQAQAMQKKMLKIEQELEETEVTGSSGGGLVEVVYTGKAEFKSIKLDKEVVDPEDVEMLEDLITAAINDAKSKATELKNDRMAEFGPAASGMMM